MPVHRFIADYATREAFLEAVDAEVANGGVLLRGVPPAGVDPECVVEFRVAGQQIAEASGRVGATGRFGVTVTFDEPPPNVLAVAAEWRAGGSPVEAEPESPAEPEVEDAPRGTVAERIAALTVGQKIALAISADRESRLQLFRDINKSLHAYVLRNPRIQVEEVLFAAKLNGLSADALKAIAEHKEWGPTQSTHTRPWLSR